MTDPALIAVLERAERERDQALAAQRRADEHARRARAQADQLAAYRADYEQRWRSRFGGAGGGGIELVQCHGDFMSRLEQALAQQQGVAAGACAQAEALRERVLAAELRVASLKKLLERRAAERARGAARHEQRQVDDFAAQAHRRAAAALHRG